MDKVSRETRSRNMSLIRAKNTQPELLVRKALHKLGFRYRIHYPLPGKPDIIFPPKKVAVFIHGCFWHGHGCEFDHKPKSHKLFWSSKITKNKERDSKNYKELKDKGWLVVTVWECDIKKKLNNAVCLIIKELKKKRVSNPAC